MKTRLFTKIKPLFDQILPSKRVLLAYSGGPDSQALFHLLLEYLPIGKIELGIVHINHNLREESSAEAAEIEQTMKQQKIPSFCYQLTGFSLSETNLEERIREKRLEYYQQAVSLFTADYLLTAHHGDDQAETIIKRIFEGTSISNFHGIGQFSSFGNIKFFRPLLGCRKNELIEYLNIRKIPYFIDSTNFDGSNLRSRMRASLIPMIADAFGKDPTQPILRLQKQLLEIEEELSQRKNQLIKDGVLVITQRMTTVKNPSILSRGMLRFILDTSLDSLSFVEKQQVIDAIYRKKRCILGSISITPDELVLTH